jgi:predicted O-linked N-acetylglucosamine transferase (SPINDLY family)
LADPVLVPPEYAMYYTEKIAYLPKVFQANDQKREVSDIIWSRQEMGLPEGAFVFCCFNQSYKILPEVFSVWMRLLDRVPNSVLWLIANTALAQENLKKEALVRGIDPARLVFAQKLPVAQYLACYRLVDLFLDTWPYNAGATASDALWMGVPVISYMGQTFSSRMAGALLHALELPELMVNDIKAYETKAYTLATQPKVLVQIKQKLTDQVKVSNVFKGAIIAKQIEAIYLKMIKRHYDKLPPDMLSPNEDSI